MGWFSSAPAASPIVPGHDIPSSSNLASELKPQGPNAEKVKPCCVCKDEKSARDECMLFSRSDDAQEDCKGLVSQYKDCMKGYGFKGLTDRMQSSPLKRPNDID